MPQVGPFSGLHFNPQRVGDLSAVISPPYDIISPEEQALHYRRSPYNVVRLELPLPPPGRGNSSRYREAARAFRSWLREGVLVRDERPAFYLVEHRFPCDGGSQSRWGIIARVKLQEWSQGRVRPHEEILRAPAADRYELLRTCRANFSPVMGIFRSRRGVTDLFPGVVDSPPRFTARDDYGVTYSVWLVTNPEAIRQASRFLSRKTLYIADGHHRYSMALAYMMERRKLARRHTGREPFNYVMMALMSTADPGLIPQPTHRLVKGLSQDALARLEAGIGHYFRELSQLSRLPALSGTAPAWLEALQGLGKGAFGVYARQGGIFRILAPREMSPLQAMLPPDQPEVVRTLDVSLLHGVVLGKLLGIATRQQEEACLEFTRDPLEAINRVDSGEFQLAFFLNPLPLKSLFAVADAGARLPQKTTYFYPKTATGLVVNPLF